MVLSKCKWFNDHQAPCCLMIDDLVPAAVSLDGTLGAHNDWGYLMDQPGSLFSYFKRNLLEKFPEIRGTIFFPLESQHEIPVGRGYTVYKRDIDEKYVTFLKSFSNVFELAFHGIRHTFKTNNIRCFEFEKAKSEDFDGLKKKIDNFAKRGIEFVGGKFPGYRYNDAAIDFIKFMGFKWFALDAGMINRKHLGNKLININNTKIIGIPTNLSGDTFNKKTKQANFLKRSVKRMLFPGRYITPNSYIKYLVIHGLPITIQEHFQNQATSGKRQTPNIYDDICSLERIFGLLRPFDVWYASCSEIAHYYDSYVNTDIIASKNGEFEIRYRGNWDNMLLSMVADFPLINNLCSGKSFRGIQKNGRFVFNCIFEGTYRSCR